jgi:hypothetical protein
VLDSIQGDANHFVEDSRIADVTKLSLELVRDWLIRLSEHEMVAVAQTTRGISAFLEARGRIEIQQVEQRRSWPTKGAIPSLQFPVAAVKHLRYYSAEVFFRIQEVLRRAKDSGGVCRDLACIDGPEELSQRDSKWFNGEGCYLVLTCYLSACLFSYAKEVKEDFLANSLPQDIDAELMRLLLKVSLGFLKDLGVFYVTQDGIGELVHVEGRHGVMSYIEYCSLLLDAEKRVWLDRLCDFYLAAGRGNNLARLESVLRAILDLSDFLDVLIGMGPSVRERLKAEGLERLSADKTRPYLFSGFYR